MEAVTKKPKMKQGRGIIIFGLGHENYYRMAEVLAASLVANGTREAGIGIALLCDDESRIDNRDLFTDIVKVERDLFMVDDKLVFNNATVRMYGLTPFEFTMKLDADLVWLVDRPVAALFDALAEEDIAFQTTGHGWGEANSNSVWAEEDDIIAAYNLDKETHKLYKLFGEFLYFKKCDRIKKYFEQVVRIYKGAKVACTSFSNGNFTDELAYQVACMLTGIYPPSDNFTPIYNQFLGMPELIRMPTYELPAKGFYGYSVGGKTLNAFTKKNYNILSQHYFNTLGIPNPYQVIDKRSYLPERKKL